MKKILLLLVLIPYFSNGQIQYKDDGSIYFDKVYQVDLEKEEIKSSVNEWMALNFNDSDNVIKMNTTDKIIANGIVSVLYDKNKIDQVYRIKFSLITEFKKERYKILINNFSLEEGIPNIVIDKELISKEEYKRLTIANAEKLGKTKWAKKFIERDNKFSDLYEDAKRTNEFVLNVFLNEVKTMAGSLNNHVQKMAVNNDNW